MKRYLDGKFWAEHFRRVFIPQIEAFTGAVVERLLPTFDAIELEANEIAEAEYQRIGALPATEWSDMADAAEAARDEGLGHYETMTAVRQSMLNLAAAALFHMVEQQLLLFHRRQVLFPREENDASLFDHRTRHRLLKEAGVDLEDLPSWMKFEEMRLLANTVKHGDGHSAEKLRTVRPDLLTHPIFRGTGESLDFPAPVVRTPLAGDSVFVAVTDFEAFGGVAVSFWNELANAVENTAA